VQHQIVMPESLSKPRKYFFDDMNDLSAAPRKLHVT
jgi:hypothetical protein